MGRNKLSVARMGILNLLPCAIRMVKGISNHTGSHSWKMPLPHRQSHIIEMETHARCTTTSQDMIPFHLLRHCNWAAVMAQTLYNTTELGILSNLMRHLPRVLRHQSSLLVDPTSLECQRIASIATRVSGSHIASRYAGTTRIMRHHLVATCHHSHQRWSLVWTR